MKKNQLKIGTNYIARRVKGDDLKGLLLVFLKVARVDDIRANLTFQET